MLEFIYLVIGELICNSVLLSVDMLVLLYVLCEDSRYFVELECGCC